MENNNVDFKWYMIRVRTNKEKDALENVKTEVRLNNLEKYVLDYLIPTERRVIVSRGKKINRESLVFPGYVMIHCQMIGELPRTIKKSNFVSDIIGDNGKPTPLKESEVSKIIGDIEVAHSDDTHLIGDVIKIMDGPFSGFNGSILNINTDKNKLEIAVMIFGKETKMEIKSDQCERIKN